MGSGDSNYSRGKARLTMVLISNSQDLYEMKLRTKNIIRTRKYYAFPFGSSLTKMCK